MSDGRKRLYAALISAVIIVTYHLIFFRFFPNRNGMLGHDYSLFIPRMMDGLLWAKHNGYLSIPWFTPSFCGGVPAFPDPQNIYFSLPQVLTLFTNPLHSVYLTFVAMSILGYAGCYVLLRRVFATSTSATITGATLFLFNGFFVYRLIIGHLTYHSYMLFPWILYFLLKNQDSTNRAGPIQPWLLNGTAVGFLAGYMFYSGMVNLFLPLALSGLVILLAYAHRYPLQPVLWKTSATGMVIFLLLIAGKLNASLAYLQHFGRDAYPLPGMAHLVDAFLVPLRSLFYPSTESDMQHSLTNIVWGQARHEFEYGVGLAPLLVFGAYIYVSKKGKQLVDIFAIKPALTARNVRIAMICVLLLLPVALNYYQADWNHFLKQIPIIKNSSSLLRFYAVYILPIVLLAAFLIDRTFKSNSSRLYVAVFLCLLTVLVNAFTDKEFYQAQKYDPLAQDLLHEKLVSADKNSLPRITYIGNIEETNRFKHSSQEKADFLFGISRLKCYEPMFGYFLEAFPVKTLHRGAVDEASNGYLNIKNPSCYVFPKANNCEPGDHFKATDKQEAERFLSYRGFDFKMPVRQTLLDRLSLLALVGGLLILIVGGVMALQTRARK